MKLFSPSPSHREIPEAWSSPLLLRPPSFFHIFLHLQVEAWAREGNSEMPLSSFKWLRQEAKMCQRPSELPARGLAVGMEGSGNKSTPQNSGYWDPVTRLPERAPGPKAWTPAMGEDSQEAGPQLQLNGEGLNSPPLLESNRAGVTWRKEAGLHGGQPWKGGPSTNGKGC